MIESIYHMTLKLLINQCFLLENINILPSYTA